MDSQPSFNLSEISIEDVLKEITNQDIVFWKKNSEVEDDKCALTKHGNLVLDIHNHFRKLQPEYCSHFSEDVIEVQSNIKTDHANTETNPLPKERILSDESMPFESSAHDNNLSGFSRESKSLRQRKRHISEGSHGSGVRRPSSIASSFRESCSPGRFSGLLSDHHSSVESLQSEFGSRMSQRLTNTNLYDAALECCLYPVLASTQIPDSDDEDPHSLPVKDFSRSMSERLSKYLGNVFHVNVKKHKQLRSMQSHSRGGKRAKLEQDLRQQLKLLEENSHPYYSPNNFSSPHEHKMWQDQERREITTLLRNQIPRLKQLPKNKDRCMEYKKIMEKVIAYDIEAARKQFELSSDRSSSSDSNSGSDSRSHCHRNRLLSKRGKRLLAEFAARYRVGVPTQACFFLFTAEECLEDEILALSSITFKALTKKLDFIYELIEEGTPFCVSEIENLVIVTEKFIQRMKQLVITLLTVWQPSTRELRNGLEFARAAFQVFDALRGNEDEIISEWPECLSDWFESATVEKYKECKRPNFKEEPEMVLASVSHAVNVMKMMQKGKKNETQTDYEAVFGSFISNFPQAVSTGLYEAVMADVKYLANALPWIKFYPTVPGRSDHKDSLNLHDIALAYKLAEFDNLVKIREIDASKPRLHERNFSWRKAYHPLAMHWLDVLSCHMRKQVVQAVAKDKFDSPDFDDFSTDARDNTLTGDEENNTELNQESKSTRLRYGSLLRRDPIEQRSTEQDALSEVEEESDCHQHDGKSHQSENEQLSDTEVDALMTMKPTPEKPCNVESMKLVTSSDHVCIDEEDRQTCQLISYKPLAENDYDSTQSATFYSCNTGGESSSTMLKSAVDSSDRDFSSAISNSDAEMTCSSTVVSDGDSSTLPQIVPTKIHPQNLLEVNEAVWRSDDCENRRGSLASETSELEIVNHNNVICNVSSSLIDIVAVITRFMHFVKTIGDTVYRLPDAHEHDESLVVSLEDQCDCMEARDMKDRFIQKAAQMLCGVIQQYADNILSIELRSLSRDTQLCIIGQKILLQIETGMSNGMISRPQCVENSFLTLQSEQDWGDDIVRKMIVRLNNLLVLKHGMSYLWDEMEKLFERTPTISVPPSTHVSALSISTQSDSSYNSDMPDSKSVMPDPEPIEIATSSDDVTQPSSSSVCTVISHTEVDDENNNNDCQQDEEYADSLQSSAESLKEPNYENVELVSGAWVVVDTPETTNVNFYTVSTIDFLKEQTKAHLDHVVTCSGKLTALKCGNWFAYFIRKALDNPPGNDKKETVQMKDMKSHLESLLDLFATWTHEEGINALHENLWLTIIRGLKDRIVLLKQLNDDLCRIHAEHIRRVFTYVLDAWYRHPSKPNNRDLEWLSRDIKPSLTLLELYCMSAPSLINVYNKCRWEQPPEFDETVTSKPSLGEILVHCKRTLLEKKSFSGELFHHTILTILMMKTENTLSNAQEKAAEFCQNMLTSNWIEFLFRKRHDEDLPDVVPIIESSQETSDKLRTESISTDKSQQSIATETSSSGWSSESDLQRIFNCSCHHFYKFSEKISSFGILDDIRRATDSSKPEVYNTFLIDLLRQRSRTDEETKSLLLEHGLIKKGLIKSCFSCFV